MEQSTETGMMKFFYLFSLKLNFIPLGQENNIQNVEPLSLKSLPNILPDVKKTSSIALKNVGF